jgi:MGT family glycosyltransferase
MARFLFTVWPFPGHVHPAIAVALGLRERGHESAFYTGGSARTLVESEGFQCFPFVKVDEERINALLQIGMSRFNSAWDALLHVRKIKNGLQDWLLGTVPHQLEDLSVAQAKCRPDVLVCETAFWAPILVLQETGGVPVAVLSTLAACVLPGPDVPAWGRGRPRPRNWRMRLRTKMERKLVYWFSADFRGAVNALRRQHGLAPLSISVTELAGQMPLYLVPSTPEFDYQRRDLPPSVHYVGPCLWDKPRSEPPPSWLDQLPADRPVIHVTEGTIHVHEPFLLRAAARGLANRPMEVVMTTGRHRDPREPNLGTLAPNIRVEHFVPHSDLFHRTAAAVTTGGAGTLVSALQAGVPLVVVPTEWDKPENAQRVVEAGAGIRLEPRQCTPERLRAAVERVLSEPSFRSNARRLADAFARYGGPLRAAELLEGLAARRAASAPAARWN